MHQAEGPTERSNFNPTSDGQSQPGCAPAWDWSLLLEKLIHTPYICFPPLLLCCLNWIYSWLEHTVIVNHWLQTFSLTLSVCPSQEDSGAKNAFKKTNASIICFISILLQSTTRFLRSKAAPGMTDIREASGCLAQAKADRPLISSPWKQNQWERELMGCRALCIGQAEGF